MKRNIVGWAVAALVIFLFWSVSSRIQRDERQLSFSAFLSEVESGRVDRVLIEGESVVGNFTNGQGFRTVAPPQAGESFVEVLRENGVEINARATESVSWLGYIISWTPIVFTVVFLSFVMRRIGAGRSSRGWSDEQRREMKLSILYRLADAGLDVSEDEIVSALAEPGRPSADALKVEVRRALYEMLSDGTVELTPEKRFRARQGGSAGEPA